MKRSDPARSGKSAAALLSLLLVLALSFAVYRSLPERWERAALLPEEGLSLSLSREEPFSLADFLAAPPAFEGEAAQVLNGNVPLFTEEELRMTHGLRLSELDALGRCGPALACLGPETLPAEERGPIGEVRPSGWHTVRYDDRIEDRYLYNRCHLIGYNEHTAKQRCCFAAQQSCAAKSFLAFRHPIIIITSGRENLTYPTLARGGGKDPSTRPKGSLRMTGTGRDVSEKRRGEIQHEGNL